MKAHTPLYKDTVCLYGRELDSIITYTLNDEEIELRNEELNSVSPHFEGSILKSVMRQLDIDSNVDIPLNTILNYQFGINVGDDIETGEPTYEYINFGNYIVYKSEKQEDTNSYKITCYDKMLYAMKDYEQFNTTYPITIRNYIGALCTYLGLTFKNASDTFPNYNKNINTELFLNSEGKSIGYTFRDVLDQLAEVTASTICINEDDDSLEIRYINDTSDIINEEYFKDINVNFGEVTKPINTIVLSRAGGSDKVYRSYPENLPDDQKNAIEIADNQFMNFNDRDTYLPDILNKLLGLTYSLNDFSSTGITYYDLCDRYSVKIGDNTYSCVMFNDEINVTQGLEELVHTDLPSETVTDYTKADKTDRRINETYLIVDKQNQTISSVVTDVGEQNEKISTIEQTVNEINSKISDIADITTSAEDTDAQIELNEINQSEPVQLKVHPVVQNISYLYPSANLYPSEDLFMTIRTIRFHNTETNEDFDYELPEDLLYYDNEHYDEFLLDYGDGETTKVCQVTKRCKWNADGTVGLLTTPETHTYTYPYIPLTDGDYVVSILSYSYGYIFARLMAKNIYTTQFYTKAETNSLIEQKDDEIEIGVTQTLTNYVTTEQMNAQIGVKADQITSSVSATYETKNDAVGKFDNAKAYTDEELQAYSTTQEVSTTIDQKIVDNNVAYVDIEVAKKVNNSDYTHAKIVAKINDNTSQAMIDADKVDINANDVLNILAGNTLNLTSKNIAISSTNFSVTKDGKITANSGDIGSWNIDTDGLYSDFGFYIKNAKNISSQGAYYNVGVSNIYTMSDLLIAQAIVNGVIPAPADTTSKVFKHYDLNNDGVIDNRDLLIITKIIGWY